MSKSDKCECTGAEVVMSLFKYLHPDRVDVLSGQAVRFSSPAVLNDPFELKPHLAALASPDYIEAELNRRIPELLHEELAKLPSELRLLVSAETLKETIPSQLLRVKKDVHGMAELLMPKLQEVMARKFEDLVGILCLSEVADSLLMWAHYADSHRGFLIEFDEMSPFFDRRVSHGDELRHLRKVTYKSQRPTLTLADIEDISSLMTKGCDWKYEAEWRMIMSLDSASKTIGEGAHAVHLFEFPAEVLTSVVLGCRMSEAKKVEIRKMLAESPHYGHVRCVEAEIDNERYRIHVPL
jgi:Protein of unknown function (DUF2971)